MPDKWTSRKNAHGKCSCYLEVEKNFNTAWSALEKKKKTEDKDTWGRGMQR